MKDIGISKFKIELFENFECETNFQLREKEQEIINIKKPSLNNFKALITNEEKKEYNSNYQKSYSEKNKDVLKTYKKEWEKKKTLCDCGKEVRICKIKRHKLSKYHIERTK